jgi:hypothetical protein
MKYTSSEAFGAHFNFFVGGYPRWLKSQAGASGTGASSFFYAPPPVSLTSGEALSN